MRKNTKSTILKSIIATTLSIASISPIAIALGKQIIDDYQNKLLNDLSRQVQSWTDMQNINTAEASMFYNTENLVSLSSIGRGQMVIPYGWLGTYSTRTAVDPSGTLNSDNNKDYHDNTLVLVGWDGSIIWANNENNIRIYSAKYHFKSDTIFVVRTQDPTGTGGINDSFSTVTTNTKDTVTSLTIHDAKTGKLLYDSLGSNSNPTVSQGWNFKKIFDSSFINDASLYWDQYSQKDLYFQDVVTLGNGDIIWYYLPNPMKMATKLNDFNQKSNLITLDTYSKKILVNNNDSNEHLGKILLIKKADIDNVKNNTNNASINPIDITNAVFSSYVFTHPNSIIISTSCSITKIMSTKRWTIITFLRICICSYIYIKFICIRTLTKII